MRDIQTMHYPWPVCLVGPGTRGWGSERVCVPSQTHSWPLLLAEHQRAELALGKHFCSNLISNGRLAPSSSPYFEQCSFQGRQIWQRIQTLQTALRLVGRGRGGEVGAGKGRYVVTNPKPTASKAAAFTWGRKEAVPREFSTA